MSQRNIETDPQTFLSLIERWDGQTPAFEDVVLNGITLSILYGGGSILLMAIANACRVSYREVQEWASGTSAPHEGLRTYVVTAIHRTLEQHYRAYDSRYQPTSHVRRVSRPIGAVSNE